MNASLLRTSVEQNYMYVTEKIRAKSEVIVNYLFDDQILDDFEIEDVMSQAANTLKAIHLLDNLLKQGEVAFESLYAATLYTKLWKVSDIMEPKRAPHEVQESIPLVPLPDNWPDQEYLDSLNNKGLEVKPCAESDKRMRELYENSKKNNVYEMTQKVKGRALIINNHNFDHLSERKGTEYDENGLETVLKHLQFEVSIHRDRNKQQMEDLLQDECKRDHSEYNCFFLFILSHGHKGIVFGTDGEEKLNQFKNFLEIDSIRNQFKNVTTLAKKPKFFFIQACQGSSKSEVIKEGKPREQGDEDNPPEDEDEDEDDDDEEMEGKRGEIENRTEQPHAAGLDCAATDENDQEPTEGEDAGNVGNREDGVNIDGGDGESDGGNGEGDGRDDDISDESNNEDDDGFDPYDDEAEQESSPVIKNERLHFYLALPTTEGNIAYRHPKSGSWFIQAFIFVLTNYSYKEDLLTLMEKVRTLVSRATDPKKRKGKTIKEYKSISQDQSTLIKKFYFFPGMPLNMVKKS